MRAIVCALSGAAMLCLGAAPAAAADEPVMSVGFLDLTPPTATVKVLKLGARGHTATSGWTNAKLSPKPTFMPPADGVYDFTFSASKPPGMVTQVVTVIIAETLVWTNPPAGMKAIRVTAKTNCMIQLMPGVPRKDVNPGKCTFAR